jgi:RimJ/RimL family protein N-acetyltransferase
MKPREALSPPPTLSIPALDTERLTLRGYCAADFEDCAALWGDPAVTRYIGGKPQTREEVWGRYLRYLGHWMERGFGYWAVRERASGRFVGDVGVATLLRATEPVFHDAPEAGWVLAPWSHGKGFATEAIAEVLRWCDEVLAAPRVVCIIDHGNAASANVARKAGFRQLDDVIYRGEPVQFFERRGG